MAIYYNKNFMESAIEDSFNDPDNPGIDLDQVEEDIAGDNGIAAHQDEVEAAAAGVIDDPIDEAFTIIAEGEYNYNKIMETVGLYESSQVAMGREPFYEAADIKGFFKTIKDWFVKQFKKIAQSFKIVFAKFTDAFRSDKAFATKYGTLITDGYNRSKEDKDLISIKGYPKLLKADTVYKILDKFDKKDSMDVDAVKNYITEFDKLIRERKSISNFDNYSFEKKTGEEGLGLDLDNMIKTMTGLDADTIPDMVQKMREEIFGTEKVEMAGTVTADDVIAIMKKEGEIKKLKQDYDKIKKSFDESIKILNKLEKDISSMHFDNDTVASKLTANVSKLAAAMRLGKNVTTAQKGVYIKALKTRRAMARKVAVAYKNLAHAKKVRGESASMYDGIFSGVDLV